MQKVSLRFCYRIIDKKHWLIMKRIDWLSRDDSDGCIPPTEYEQATRVEGNLLNIFVSKKNFKLNYFLFRNNE